MTTSNLTNIITNTTPLWHFINDILIILINTVGICVALCFTYFVVRIEYPTYSISNLLACKTCIAIGLASLSILINSTYALMSDFRGIGYEDSFCTLRGTLSCILFVKMYTSLCLKAFNRLRCIVYRIRPVTKPYRYLCIIIFIQWCFVAILVLPILLSNGIEYDWDSYLCLVKTQKIHQFAFLMIIYYVSIGFISSVYLYILYHVMHLPLLERYRRKRQIALLRRILILLLMLTIPGIAYLILIVLWLIYGTIPVHSFKLVTLVESIGHTGTLITIFLSNSRVRHRKIFKKQKKKFPHIQQDQVDIIMFKSIRDKRLVAIPSTMLIDQIIAN